MWKVGCNTPVVLCRFGHDTLIVRQGEGGVDSIGLMKVKLTLSMSYVGVGFLVGSVESSGSAEEEGEG